MLSETQHAVLTHALRSIGVMHPVPEGCDWPVMEGDYLKFMGGPHFDRVACDQFELWLHRLGFSYERNRDRSIRKIEPAAASLVWRLWGLDDLGERTVRKIDPTTPVLYPSHDYLTFVGGTEEQRRAMYLRLLGWLDERGYSAHRRDPESCELGLNGPLLKIIATEWLGHLDRQPWSAPQVAA